MKGMENMVIIKIKVTDLNLLYPGKYSNRKELNNSKLVPQLKIIPKEVNKSGQTFSFNLSIKRPIIKKNNDNAPT